MMEEIERIEMLMAEILFEVENMLSRGEILSAEYQDQIADTIMAATARLEELRSQNNIPPPIGEIEQEEAQAVEEITQQPEQQTSSRPPPAVGLTQAMPSSNIDSFSYNPQTENLYVRFLGQYPNRQGPIYQYEGVPIDIFKIFRKGAVPAKTDGKNRWGSWWKGKQPSIGAAMYALIKQGNYPYSRVG